MKKNYLLLLFFTLLFSLHAKNEKGLNWGEGGAQFVTYPTITGKSGFITTPSAYCAPMGTLMIGADFTFSSRAPYAALAVIPKITFTPFHLIEFGFSKALAYYDEPNTQANMYFDSTPFFFHYKIRFVDWYKGAVAFGQDFEVVPDDSGHSSRGSSGTSLYFVFTGITSFIGSFNFGFGKTFHFTRHQDLLFNFFASWIYSVEKLDNRLQFLIDFSNADYRSGHDAYKIAHESRAYLNMQVRGVLVKTPHFQWTIMASIYDIFDIGGTWVAYATPNINASLGTSINIDLY